MCLLTLIPTDVVPDMARFQIAAKNNPDGFGFAILEKTSIITYHSMKFEEMANQFTDLRSKHPGPATVHFRWATHGVKTELNCQPITVGGDGGTVMGHNGILSVSGKVGDTRSDSRIFAEDTLPALGGVTVFDDPKYVKLFEMWARGSKLVFLSNNPEAKDYWYIINEDDGHWDADMWWSNDSYEYYTPPMSWWSRDYAMGGDKQDDIYALDKDGYPTRFPIARQYAKAPTAQETLDRMEEEMQFSESNLYGHISVGEKVEYFTNSVDDEHVEVYCQMCDDIDVVHPDDVRTHCTLCSACLYCGNDSCQCWDLLEV